MDDPGVLALRELSTGQISDALRAVGLAPEGLLGIHPMESGARVAGPAVTVTFDAVDGRRGDVPAFFEHVFPGSILVLACHRQSTWSLWGGKRSARAKRAGAVASVIDGNYRDVEEHRAFRFPVFGREAVVAGSGGDLAPRAVNEPVLISGVPIAPGDYIVGDDSGVVSVPRAAADSVIEAAQRIRRDEDEFWAAMGIAPPE